MVHVTHIQVNPLIVTQMKELSKTTRSRLELPFPLPLSCPLPLLLSFTLGGGNVPSSLSHESPVPPFW